MFCFDCELKWDLRANGAGVGILQYELHPIAYYNNLLKKAHLFWIVCL